MRQAARAGFAGLLLAVMPLGAFAQDAVIRIEARRGADSAALAAEGWAQQFPDVVTFALPGGWVAIGLGPQDRAEATTRMEQLKQARLIPADSFIAVPEGVQLASHGGGPDAAEQDDATQSRGPGNASLATGALAGGGSALLADDGIYIDVPDGVSPDPQAVTQAQDAALPPDDLPADPVEEVEAAASHIRLQTISGRAQAEAALERWRQDLPDASLWQMPGGRFAIALGPMAAETADAWLVVMRQGGAVPQDAFTSTSDELGQQVDAGAVAELPAAEEVQDMPPLDQVQRALRWAGHYQGGIDGQDGSATRAAIAAAMVASRLTPDPGTAMQGLIVRHQEWRAELGMAELRDDHTGLMLQAPTGLLQPDRSERQLSIYGPRDDSGVALILFSQPGGTQELHDLAGMVVALGWVPEAERLITSDHILLEGGDGDSLGRAEGWVRDGRAEGYVLIWPASDGADQPHVATEISESLTRIEVDSD